MSPQIEGTAGRGRGGTLLAMPRWGFTLIELLVSMTVLVLVMVLTVQLVGRTTAITSASNKLLDTASMARIVFDRFGDDLSGAALTGGPTMLYYSGAAGAAIDPSGNSSLGFVCKTRARKISSDGSSNTNQDVRGIVVAYKVRQTPVITRPGTTLNIPLINRGDAEFTFSKAGSQGSNGGYGFSVWDMFGISGVSPLPSDLSSNSTTGDTKLLAWNGFGDGVLRFHVSFVLDDGRIVQSLNQAGLKALYDKFPSNGDPAPCQPVAFSAANSADANKRYVTGLIVGIVVLDQSTLSLGYVQDASFATTLATALKRPTADGETPVGVWQSNLSAVTSLPVQRSLRFYQRFYPVNL